MPHDDDAPIDANAVMLDVLHTGRAVSSVERIAIVQQIASTPFDIRTVRIRRKHRGITYQDVPLGARAESLAYHLVWRVVLDGQWIHGTTADEYVSDLRQAVRDQFARLMIYERRSGTIVGAIVPTERIIEPERRGARWLEMLVVIYSVEQSMIITGYQFSSLDTLAIPEIVRWLP